MFIKSGLGVHTQNVLLEWNHFAGTTTDGAKSVVKELAPFCIITLTFQAALSWRMAHLSVSIEQTRM